MNLVMKLKHNFYVPRFPIAVLAVLCLLLSCKNSTMDSIGDILKLDPISANSGKSAIISGKVTLENIAGGYVYIQNGNEAMRVNLNINQNIPLYGDHAIIRGLTGYVDEKIVLFATQYEITEKEIATSEIIQNPDLSDPENIGRLVSVRGVVQNAALHQDERVIYDVKNANGAFTVGVVNHRSQDLLGMVNNIVEITGVLTNTKEEEEVQNVEVVTVQNSSGVRVVKGNENKDPFNLEPLNIAELKNMEDGLLLERIKIVGRLADVSGKSGIIKDATGSIKVEFDTSPYLRDSRDVEAVGFLQRSDDGNILSNALLNDSSADPPSTRVISSIQEIRTMPRMIAGLGVEVRGTFLLTFIDDNMLVWLHDGESGIFAACKNSDMLNDLKAGDLVKIEGQTSAGDFAPIIAVDSIVKVGIGTFPEAHKVVDADRISGRNDSQWSFVEGIAVDGIRLGGSTVLILENEGRELQVNIPRLLLRAEELVQYQGRRVRATGVLGSTFNAEGQFLDLRIWAPSQKHLEILDDDALSADELRLSRTNDILTFDPLADQRKPSKLRGTVEFIFNSGEFYLSDDEGNIIVSPIKDLELEVGDFVEVVGYPNNHSMRIGIEQASISKIDNPSDQRISQRQSIDSARFCDERPGSSVSLTGDLISVSNFSGGQSFSVMSGTGELIQTFFQYPKNGEAIEYSIGSEVEVEGICHPADEAAGDFLELSSSAVIMIPSSSQLKVVKKAPFWTKEKFAALLLLGIISTLSILAWVYFLRRQVGSQTAIIQEKLTEAEELKNAALAADSAKSEFLANMSHEIRTPLTSVLGFAELLSNDEDQENREIADSIRKGGERLMSTLTSVLEIASLEKSSRKLRISEVDLLDLSVGVIGSFELQAKERGIQLVSDFDQDLRAIKSDRMAIERILTNLLSNALVYSDSGTKISVQIRQTSDQTEFKISDQGIGIASEFLPDLFEPFRQESIGQSRKYEGNGLGLSIVSMLVDLLQGTIRVDSKKGEGSTFTVTLPRQVDFSQSEIAIGIEDTTSIATSNLELKAQN